VEIESRRALKQKWRRSEDAVARLAMSLNRILPNVAVEVSRPKDYLDLQTLERQNGETIVTGAVGVTLM
jgi:hypothetical protein